ncbi:M55 family metallopeptidase [Candidatus Latescibacterota bacterium]
MKIIFSSILILFLVSPLSFSQSKNGMKVFISVDMEGVTGAANFDELGIGGFGGRQAKDYDYFRTLVTKEANSAIEGALAAGATEIVVRDAHSSQRNIFPDMLNKNAKLLRAHSGGFMDMVEGIDETFDAVILIGYHAKAGTPNAVLEHTVSLDIMDISINGISLPEAGINALIAGYYNVPIVFVSGDLAICSQIEKLLSDVETVSVKEGIGNAVINLHPEVSRKKIQEGVQKALLNLNKYKPYKLRSPYKMVLILKKEELVYKGSFFPGVKRTGDWELTYENENLMEVINAFQWLN